MAFRRLALDPYRQHGSPGLNQVRDLRGLWQAAVTAQPTAALKLPEKLYPLGDKAPSRKPQTSRSYYSASENVTPVSLLAQHNAMQAITGALDGIYSLLQSE